MAEIARKSPIKSTDDTTRLMAHVLAGVIGAAAAVGGIAGILSSLPVTLGVTLLVTGIVLPLLVVYSLQYSRGAWSFLISMLAVLAVVTFFGAPTIAHVLHVNLGVAAVIPTLLAVAVVLLTMVRADYRNRA